MSKKKLVLLSLSTVLIFSVLYVALLVSFTGILTHKNSYFTIKRLSKSEIEVNFVDKIPQDWVKLSNVSSKVLWPIIISEDWAFYQHSGVDWKQLFDVIEESAEKGKLTRGASTITQQVIKNLFLTSSRSVFRKFNEIILALIYENVVSKKWILEQYINLAEFGPNIYGIKKASRHYFQNPPSDLSYRQGAFLAMLLPSPIRYGESFRKMELTEFARSQIENILDKLVTAKIITEEERDLELMHNFSWEGLPSEEYFYP
ncbi:MAG: transglycosylase domain-containing protein [Halobacteriovoraceae bacterium]|nr:transglycosylase domain-containing protein [Halobacteriovoraceae bacterium]MCB9095964.1 transglycosylase domain-containing protein [Halobacteriovoraceae bacterium]